MKLIGAKREKVHQTNSEQTHTLTHNFKRFEILYFRSFASMHRIASRATYRPPPVRSPACALTHSLCTHFFRRFSFMHLHRPWMRPTTIALKYENWGEPNEQKWQSNTNEKKMELYARFFCVWFGWSFAAAAATTTKKKLYIFLPSSSFSYSAFFVLVSRSATPYAPRLARFVFHVRVRCALGSHNDEKPVAFVVLHRKWRNMITSIYIFCACNFAVPLSASPLRLLFCWFGRCSCYSFFFSFERSSNPSWSHTES